MKNKDKNKDKNKILDSSKEEVLQEEENKGYGYNESMKEIDELTKGQKMIICKFCNRKHNNSFDDFGINHDAFSVGGKAETIFNALCEQEKVRIFIPYEQGEKIGAIASPQINGLRVNILKGRYVDVPQQIAELVMESLNQTVAIPNELMTKNPYTGKIVNAKIELREEAERSRLNA